MRALEASRKIKKQRKQRADILITRTDVVALSQAARAARIQNILKPQMT